MDNDTKLLTIVFTPGTFGHFLQFFLDKFSQKTPNIAGDPFTEIGTSHKRDIQYSGLIEIDHESFLDKENWADLTFKSDLQVRYRLGHILKDMPICVIVPKTEKHFLYLKRSKWFRCLDWQHSPDDLWKKPIGEMTEMLKHTEDSKALNPVNTIIKLYGLKETAHYYWIPKFIVRDWYKLEFLENLEDTFYYQEFELFLEHKFFKDQKVFRLDLETFFDWDTFIENITELDDMFGLSLDYDRKKEMKELFDKGYSLDGIRQECNLAVDVLENRTDSKLNNLNVATEGFIYAQIEKANDYIQTPLVNRFFRDADEIRQFVEHYPNHYKAMNPNMPTFNGIPNPYYLKKTPKSEEIKDGDGRNRRDKL